MIKNLCFSLWLTFLCLFTTSVFGQDVSYKLVKDIAELSAGDEIVIVGKNNSSFYYLNSQSTNNRSAILVPVNDETISSSTIQTFVLGKNGNNWTIKDESSANLGYLYAASSSNNYLKTEANLSNNSTWNIVINNDGIVTAKSQGTYTRNLLKYNAGSLLFACYSSGQNPIYFYKKIQSSTEPTFTQPTALASFSHYIERGPSVVQSFLLKGSNLDGSSVELLAANGFEISENESEGFSTELSLNAEATINKTIYVRFNGDSVGEVSSSISVDGGGATLSIPVRGEVIALPNAPSIINTEGLSAVYNQSFFHQIQFTGTNVTFEITAGALPTGLSLNETSGIISGQSTVIGDALFDITATDSFGQSVVESFVINTIKANQTFANLVNQNVVVGDDAILLPTATEQNTTIVYTSSDDAVVRVEENRLIVVGFGEAEITATAQETAFYNTAEATFMVTVAKKNYINLGLVNVTKAIGEVVELPAINTEGEAIVYSSANEDVATVEANVLTFVGAGNTTITAVVAETSVYYGLTTMFNVVVNKRNQTIVELPNLVNNIGDVVELPVTTTEGEVIVYSSANENIAIVEANILTFVGIGRTTITAKGLETPIFNAVQKTFGIVSKDPNAIVYTGQGSFIKVNSLEDVTDGYYVVASETGAFLMTNKLTSNYLVNANSGVVNNLIVNPDINNVWIINTDGNAKTIYNEVIEKYVGWTSDNAVSLSDAIDNKYRWVFTYTNNKFNVNNVAAPVRQLSYNSGSPRFAAYANANQQELQLYKLVTVWNGETWSLGLPTATIDAVLTADPIESFTAKKVFVANANVVVPTGVTITVENNLEVFAGASITFENGSYFLQNSEKQNIGQVTYKVTSVPMHRNDMSQWSSPVAGQQIRSFSPETLFNRFWSYDEATTQYTPILSSDTDASTFQVGKGYAVRVKNTLATETIAEHEGVFTGRLNNGNISINVTKDQFGYNLIGNPYPSNLKLHGEDGFFAQNPTVEQIFIWTPHFRIGTESYGNNYITVTKTDVTGPVDLQELNVISAGQGFFVQVSEPSTIVFNNAMRVGEDSRFFRLQSADKFAISLLKNQVKVNTTAVGYFTEATAGVDHQMDAKSIETGETKIYSLIADEAYSIQARNFDYNDRVRLGYKTNQDGELTIALERNSGIFTEQQIYLLDRTLNVIHDLSAGDYLFRTTSGQFDNRFEIVYVNRNLGTTDLKSKDVVVYQQAEQLVVQSTKELIYTIVVNDALGRVVTQFNKINAKAKNISLAKGVYFIVIELENGIKVSKKVLIK